MGVQVREKLKDSGVWWLFHCQNKKRKCVRVGSYEAALETKKIIEARIALGQDPFPQLEPEPVSAPTLREWYEGYKKRILTSAREATRRSYTTSFNRILPILGDVPLDKLTKLQVQEFVAALVQDGRKKAGIRIITAELCTVLNDAVDHEIIVRNPALKLGRLFKNAPKKEDVEPFTAEEVTRILQTARSKYPQWYAMLLCTFHTGVRSGELSALGWDDIDYSVHFVHVRGSVSRYSRGVAGSTKTDSTR